MRGSHVYHEIFLHLNWHTKNNARLLQGQTEKLTYAELQRKARAISDAELIELGGTDDHVHLAIRIAPQVTVSELVQELKGASSHEVNKKSGSRALEWQRGYGVVSFGAANLDWVRAYIRNQREHHARGSVHARLEVCDAVEPQQSPAEAG